MPSYRKRSFVRRAATLALAAGLIVPLSQYAGEPYQVWGMEAPGRGGANWHYSDQGHYWYYVNEDQSIHTGWLFYEGEWYWFDSAGRMQESGYADIDGTRYYFFANGHMVRNQYLDLRYYDENGLRDEEYDVRLIGTESPTAEDRDLLTDYLYEIPRGWLRQFAEDGWQFMFYKKKKYFEAPATDLGIYYVYHSVDTRYRKVKFTDVNSVLSAFGEYVGFASGCFEKDNVWMQGLWEEYPTLRTFLEMPDYYSDDSAFFFGKAFAAYADSGTREEMERLSPKACRILEEILYAREDAETLERIRAERETREQQAREQEARRAAREGYGPGYKKETGNEP